MSTIDDANSSKVQDELVDRLLASREIQKLGGKVEAEALAHAICDIGGSATKISREIFPRLIAVETTNGLWDAVDDLRQELRHILYHIKDSKSLRAFILDDICEADEET